MQQQVSDRIAAELRQRGETLAAEEIAREHLKLMQAGPAAVRLVRAMLARDGRFAEVTPGRWGLARALPALDPPVALWTCEEPEGTRATPWLWRAWTGVWGEPQPPRSHQGAQRSVDLEAMLAQVAAGPIATARPGLLRRWLGAQERIHACPELDPLVIDLSAWERLLRAEAVAPADDPGRARSVHARPRQPAGRHAETDPGAEAPGPGALADLSQLMDEVAETARRRGLRTWDEVALVPAAAAAGAVAAGGGGAGGVAAGWDASWAIKPEQVAALPEEPGIYRFRDANGRLLYVGKAKNLRRRVESYFRPITSDSSRRAAFLAELHRLETETTGTELEALLREAEEIRTGRPAWNVQMNVECDEGGFSLSDQDLVLLLPRADGVLSLVALGGARVALARLDAAGDLDAMREALRSFYVEGSAAGGLTEVTGPERAIARRWLRWSRQGCATLRLADFATFAGLTAAIAGALRAQGEARDPAGEGRASGVPQGTFVVREQADPSWPARSPAGALDGPDLDT